MSSRKLLLFLLAVCSSQFAFGQMAVTGTVNNVSCNEGTDGAINITASNGVPPYRYSWSNGVTTEDLTGLQAGIYTVTVHDQAGASATGDFTINQPAPISLAGNVTESAYCYNNGGAIDLSVTGGIDTTPYAYSWSNGATTEDLSSLPGGTYSVTVTDANGCRASASFTVTEHPGPVASFSVAAATNCDPNQGNGAIETQVNGGTAPYTYRWSNGMQTASISGLATGIYQFVVIDANGCGFEAAVTVPHAPDIPGISLSSTPNESCDTNYNGTASAVITSPTATYSWSWTKAGDGFTRTGTEASPASITGLASGTYTLTVTAANGCATSAEVTVADDWQAPVITGAVATEQTDCELPGNGAVTVRSVQHSGVEGALSDYIFYWTDASGNVVGHGTSIYGLGAGIYFVTATKNSVNPGSGCESAPFEVVVPYMPVFPAINLDSTPNTSCNAYNGAIAADIISPTATYIWSWYYGDEMSLIFSGNESGNFNLNGLAPGLYTLEVTTADGCSATATVTVAEEYTVHPIVYQKEDVQCAGENNGSIALTKAADYHYQFFKDGMALTATADGLLTGLTTGTYEIRAEHSVTSCAAITTVTISEPAPLQLTETVQQVSAYGAADGSVELVVAGGTAPYSYQWSNGATSAQIGGLGPGTYTGTVTDAQNCRKALTFVIEEPLSLQDGDHEGVLVLARTAGGQLLVQFEGVSHAQFLKVYRLDGKLMSSADVKGKEAVEMVVPSGSPALYLLVLTSKEKVYKKKFLF